MSVATVIAELRAAAAEARISRVACQTEPAWHAEQYERWADALAATTCRCGKPLIDGRCRDYINCAFSVEGARR